MPPTPQKRDNQYYLDRLRNEHPSVYTDLQAGRFKNATEALVVAGLRKRRTALDLLTLEWGKASSAEKDAFKRHIGCLAPSAQPLTTAKIQPVAAVPISSRGKRRLPPALKAVVREVMDRRNLKVGQVMSEIGFASLDASLGGALSRDTQIQDKMVRALELWVAANGASYTPT
jgi:hypothetical protein